MQKFRKKPVMIEAVQFTTNNEVGSPVMDKIVNWINQGRDSVGAWHNGTVIYIVTPEGELRAQVGDWIIKDFKYENSICTNEVFSDIYESILQF